MTSRYYLWGAFVTGLLIDIFLLMGLSFIVILTLDYIVLLVLTLTTMFISSIAYGGIIKGRKCNIILNISLPLSVLYLASIFCYLSINLSNIYVYANMDLQLTSITWFSTRAYEPYILALVIISIVIPLLCVARWYVREQYLFVLTKLGCVEIYMLGNWYISCVLLGMTTLPIIFVLSILVALSASLAILGRRANSKIMGDLEKMLISGIQVGSLGLDISSLAFSFYEARENFEITTCDALKFNGKFFPLGRGYVVDKWLYYLSLIEGKTIDEIRRCIIQTKKKLLIYVVDQKLIESLDNMIMNEKLDLESIMLRLNVPYEILVLASLASRHGYIICDYKIVKLPKIAMRV